LKLQELAIQANLSLSPIQVELGEQYISLVLKWNKTRNLVSRSSSKKDLIEYFVDSAILSKHLQPGKVVDLGSGAGFPGLCLAVMNPHTEINLIDSNTKKTAFLVHAKNELGLASVSVKNSRVEDISKIPDENIVCRAFKEPINLLNCIADKINPRTKIWVMVSSNQKEKIPNFKTAYRTSEISKVIGKKRGFLEIQMT
tara:strand:+ start:844 stop:1440 length:597 start_codon:yes stop_codon:yes gene_type:complete